MDHLKNINMVLSNQPNIPVTVIPVMVKLTQSTQCMLGVSVFCYHPRYQYGLKHGVNKYLFVNSAQVNGWVKTLPLQRTDNSALTVFWKPPSCLNRAVTQMLSV